MCLADDRSANENRVLCGATRHHAFITQVKLEGLTQCEGQGYKGFRRLIFTAVPRTNEVGDAAVVPGLASSFISVNSALAVRRFCLSRVYTMLEVFRHRNKVQQMGEGAQDGLN